MLAYTFMYRKSLRIMASGDKKSPQLSKIKVKVGNSTVTASDSDASVETNSLSADSTTEQNNVTQTEKRRKKNRRGSEWEIMEGLKDGQRFENKPNQYSGFLHKKRKWPLKGWHKRYFVIDKGILVYGKGPSEVTKGKIHGSVDIGLSVITTKVKRRRIDIDAEEFIYHLKAKSEDAFTSWVQQLTAHRLYRQHILTYGTNIGALFKPTDGLHSIPRTPEIVSRDGSLTRGLQPPASGGRLSLWLQESLSSIEQFQRDTTTIEQNITKLTRLLQQIEASAIIVTEGITEALSPNIKKDRRKFGLKKKKSTKGGSVDLTIQFSSANKSTTGTDTDNTSPLSTNSFSALSTSPQQLGVSTVASLPVPINASAAPTPDSLSNVDVISLTTENQLREDFLALAKTVLGGLKTLSFGLSTERERLKSALELEGNVNVNQNIVSLKNNLNQVLQQNTELKSRLLRIHEASDVTDLSSLEQLSEIHRPYNASLSYSSSCVSATEFFDAEDLPTEKPILDIEDAEIQEEESEVRTRSESSSEAGSLSSGEGSISSESELGTELNPVNNSLDNAGR
ncbi:PH 8 domain containing protein [Asbolus verrucosus]|uniref:PH 8 domain containing protein n=1 Tax=Asbolus verrucosus TaxID=1661398 RepID=A0A482W7Z1_ASBVE|nr:PH 8 domain containing protein [Asbolus verrucosus]